MWGNSFTVIKGLKTLGKKGTCTLNTTIITRFPKSASPTRVGMSEVETGRISDRLNVVNEANRRLGE